MARTQRSKATTTAEQQQQQQPKQIHMTIDLFFFQILILWTYLNLDIFMVCLTVWHSLLFVYFRAAKVDLLAIQIYYVVGKGVNRT